MTLEEAVQKATEALSAGYSPTASVVMRLRDFGRDWLREQHGAGPGDGDDTWSTE